MKMFSTIRQKWILFLERIKREFVNSDEVFYIGGTDVLPPPLEKTQENMTKRRIKRQKLTICRNGDLKWLMSKTHIIPKFQSNTES